jgi:hypothetical protein
MGCTETPDKWVTGVHCSEGHSPSIKHQKGNEKAAAKNQAAIKTSRHSAEAISGVSCGRVT